jgi:xanthosine utilization system XapX-like protein
MNMAMLDTTKLSLRGGGALNYEGAGAAQWLIGIPFLFVPIIIYAPFSLMGFRELGVVTVGLIGLIGIILQKKIIDLTYKRFLDRRYKIASSFRKG